MKQPHILVCALLLATIVMAGCSRSNTSGPDEMLGPGDWTINGIYLGDSLKRVTQLFGQGKQTNPTTKYKYKYYKFPNDLSVKIDGEGKVLRITGTKLMRDGKVILQRGDLETDIIARLGTGYIARFDTPTGGMITTGYEPQFSRHNFFDGKGARIQINCCEKGGPNVGNFHLTYESSDKRDRYH